MPLPNLEKIIPIFDVVIPSTQETVKFRPFLVKEEKLLLIALDGADEKEMLQAVVQVIADCAMSPLKVDSLANFDLEYIFLQLRARSVNDVVELSYRCMNIEKEGVDGKSPVLCNNIVKVNINLQNVQVQFNPMHTKTIYLTDTMGMTLRYPNSVMAKKLFVPKSKIEEQKVNLNDAISSIAMCVESVFDETSVYSNFQAKEITEWIEKLTQHQFAKIQEFFETMPKLAYDVPFKCGKCDHQDTIHLEGLAAFFG